MVCVDVGGSEYDFQRKESAHRDSSSRCSTMGDGRLLWGQGWVGLEEVAGQKEGSEMGSVLFGERKRGASPPGAASSVEVWCGLPANNATSRPRPGMFGCLYCRGKGYSNLMGD